MKRSAATAILCFLTICGFSQLQSHCTVTREYYENGNIRKIISVRVTASKHFDLFNYYKKTKTKVTEFYPNGKVKSYSRKVTKIGDAGRACYEIVNLMKSYNENGTIVEEVKEQCDKIKNTTKYYDDKGNLTFTKIIWDFTKAP